MQHPTPATPTQAADARASLAEARGPAVGPQPLTPAQALLLSRDLP